MSYSPSSSVFRPPSSAVSLAQAGYYIVTGVWPIVHIPSFMKVSGPKVDTWLVKTAGVLITTVGTTLAVAGLRGQDTPEIPLLGVGSAAGLAGIDIVYVAKRRISPVYLLDALAELALIGAWFVALKRQKRS